MLLDHGTSIAENFSKYVGLSRPFVLAMRGFWELDNQNHEQAISYLCDPSVDLDDPPEFEFKWNEKIIKCLSISNKPLLISKFINTTMPALWSVEISESVFDCLLKSSITAAIEFCRSRLKLENCFKVILDSCFFPSIDSNRIKQLIRVPLQRNEEAIIVNYCQSSKSEFCHDFLLTFFIQRGRYTEALKMNDILFKNRNNSVKDKQRLNLMNNVSKLLPPIIRNMFDLGAPSLNISSKPKQVLLQTLHDNYISNTPAKNPQTVSLHQSPASPFLQPPYTPPTEIFMTTTTNNVQDSPAHTPRESRLSNDPNLPIISPSFTKKQSEEKMDPSLCSTPVPPLISKSPFVTKTTPKKTNFPSTDQSQDLSTTEPVKLRRSPRIPKRSSNLMTTLEKKPRSQDETLSTSAHHPRHNQVTKLSKEPVRRTPSRKAKKSHYQDTSAYDQSPNIKSNIKTTRRKRE
jgi:hypothetical protein